ncbi:hypothetical protein [Sulfuricurvum sp.]|uniref:hypothetical protein n=1 Tax=Sulfuricurvum sp. TaxID=2025608 RepID=UPI002E33075E|nr:hypothetical protein [Sulfuricurvum sp.]HEX5330268.1 hypothetical protein [Sulfuricurvum sp.]
MTTKQYSHYLPFLAQNYNIVLFSNKHYEAYNEAKTFFASGIQRNMQNSELDNINITLMSNKIDIVLLDTTEDPQSARKFYEAIESYNDRIVILSIINREMGSDVIDLVELSDTIVFDTCTYEELKGKLVQILSVFYTIISIGRREVNLKSGSSDVTMLVDFLDFYQGSSLFIVDELIELNQRLKAGELSKELLSEIGGKILDISEIFSKHTLFVRVAPTFKDLGNFLNKLDFSTIPPNGLKAFDYLSEIIDDLNKNMMDIFVDRIFQDVHVFEDSLQNNIEFMKSNLFSKVDEDESELDFF